MYWNVFTIDRHFQLLTAALGVVHRLLLPHQKQKTPDKNPPISASNLPISATPTALIEFLKQELCWADGGLRFGIFDISIMSIISMEKAIYVRHFLIGWWKEIPKMAADAILHFTGCWKMNNKWFDWFVLVPWIAKWIVFIWNGWIVRRCQFSEFAWNLTFLVPYSDLKKLNFHWWRFKKMRRCQL